MESQKKKNKTLLAVGLSTFFLSLSLWSYNQYNLAVNFCYKIKKETKFTNVSATNVRLKVALIVRNFSSIKATITGFKLNVYLNGTKLSTVVSNKEQIINAKGTSDIDFEVIFNPKEIFSNDYTKMLKLISTITNKDENAIISIKGFAYAKVIGIPIPKIPIDIQMTMKEIMADSESEMICDIK